jgi:hypothetical protein
MAQQSSANTSSTLGKMIIDRVFPSPAADEQADIDGTYNYNFSDLHGQDHIRTLRSNLVVGDFMTPFKDSNDITRGWLSWRCLSYAETNDHKKENLTVNTILTLTIGTKTDNHTYYGAKINIEPSGYYGKDIEYKFCVSDCKGDKATVSITNVDNEKRVVVVNRDTH